MASVAGRVGRGMMGAAAAGSKRKKAGLVKHPAYACLGSVVNAQLKANQTPPSTSQLGKFLGIRDPPRSDVSKLISKFIKLHNRQNPGMKRDRLSEDKVWTLLQGKERVGIPEIAKLLSQQSVRR
ncbi:hypothetical protein Tsubulata_035719 [Turnera subulata]|uniref:DM2 domain-containing protein n=1 Tax=Turnera subulata TaxID=218843 RepID=A0A9Q0G1A3_9ROSI|nr:hypothetical protein Tsubulata_035719 [Turnera subulata]